MLVTPQHSGSQYRHEMRHRPIGSERVKFYPEIAWKMCECEDLYEFPRFHGLPPWMISDKTLWTGHANLKKYRDLSTVMLTTLFLSHII